MEGIADDRTTTTRVWVLVSRGSQDCARRGGITWNYLWSGNAEILQADVSRFANEQQRQHGRRTSGFVLADNPGVINSASFAFTCDSGRAQRALGARVGRPGNTASTSCPSLTTATPFTKTKRIPSEYWSGSSYVAWSMTVLASKTVMSASAPTRIRPLSLKAGARFSKRCAGISVIFFSAVIKFSAFSSRT